LSENIPRISVIIPVYNGDRFLGDAIASVIHQSLRPYEIIVVDDGSEDGTAAIAQSYTQVKYFFQSNRGVSAARNSGIDLSTGSILTFLDHDDLMLPDSLKNRIDFLIQNPHIQCLIAKHESFQDKAAGNQKWIKPDEFDAAHFGFGYLMVRRSFFEIVGKFNPEITMCENIDLLIRAQKMGVHFTKFPEVVVKKRVHAANVSRNVDSAQLSLLRIIQTSIHKHA